eukprot:jgi/Mesvir1/7841/Mv11776-RA.2
MDTRGTLRWGLHARPAYFDAARVQHGPKKQFTCIYHVSGGKVLLGHKKTSSEDSCVGKVDGFGGKVQLGQDPNEQALIRWNEETATKGHRDTLKCIAEVFIVFRDKSDVWQNYIYLLGNFDGQPAETAAMTPTWWTIAEVPYDCMWPDIQHWLPRVLTGKADEPYFRATFVYEGNTCVWGHIADLP